MNKTPLHWAVVRGFLRMVRLMLIAGANVDAIDLAGRSPLILAVKMKKVDVLRILFMYFPNPNIKTFTNKSIFDFC